MPLARSSSLQDHPPTSVVNESVTPDDLRNEDAGKRRRAALELQDPESVSALVTALKSEEAEHVQMAIFESLRAIGTDAAGGKAIAGELVDLLGSENADLRSGTVSVLKSLGRALEPHLDALLNHSDSDIRIMALDVLQDLELPQTSKYLADVLMNDNHPNVVGTALDRMAEIATRENLDAITAAAKRFPDDPYIAFVSDNIRDAIQRQVT